jgi:hypothetical protein
MTTGAPPHMIPQHLAALGSGTSRRLPLCACCYQVVMGYNVWCPPYYMGGPGYKSPTRTLHVTCPHLIQHKSKRNPTRTLIFDTTQQTPPWRIFSTTLNSSKRRTFMYSRLGCLHELHCYFQPPRDSTCNYSPFFLFNTITHRPLICVKVM